MREALTALGLSATEITAYLACLEIGGSGVAAIRKKSGVKRSTLYDALARLVEKGFIVEYRADKKIHYKAIDPQLLLKRQREKERVLEGVIPSLLSLASKESMVPQVDVYSGERGVRELLDEIGSGGLVFGSSVVYQKLGRPCEWFSRGVIGGRKKKQPALDTYPK